VALDVTRPEQALAAVQVAIEASDGFCGRTGWTMRAMANTAPSRDASEED